MKLKPLKKFFMNKGVVICSIILAIVSLLIYLNLRISTKEISVQVSSSQNNKEQEIQTQEYIEKTALSEVSLVVFSVIASSCLSTLFIEKRNTNKIIEEIFVDDFFTSDKFVKLIDEKDKKSLIKALEKDILFEGSKEKSEMYLTVREKLNSPDKEREALFYEKFYMDIKCEIKADYIEKKIVKNVRIKSINKSLRATSYRLLSTTLQEIAGVSSVEFLQLKINNQIKNKNVKTVTNDTISSLDKKSGYDKNIEYVYNGVLDFSNKEYIEIETQYITRCPLSDLAFACRMPYPCKNFEFKYSIVNSEEYEVIPTAFGFIDDAKNSPNHLEDRKSVSINFNDWIFPLDGVCVYLEKNVAK